MLRFTQHDMPVPAPRFRLSTFIIGLRDSCGCGGQWVGGAHDHPAPTGSL